MYRYAHGNKLPLWPVASSAVLGPAPGSAPLSCLTPCCGSLMTRVVLSWGALSYPSPFGGDWDVSMSLEVLVLRGPHRQGERAALCGAGLSTAMRGRDHQVMVLVLSLNKAPPVSSGFPILMLGKRSASLTP